MRLMHAVAAATLALSCAAAVPTAHAADADARLQGLLKSENMKYEVDSDGDIKLVIEWEKEGRSQVVFIDGSPNSMGDMRFYNIFSPVLEVSDSKPLSVESARKLLKESGTTVVGGFILGNDGVYFSAKFPANVSAAELHKLISAVAESADNMEIELESPDKKDRF